MRLLLVHTPPFRVKRRVTWRRPRGASRFAWQLIALALCFFALTGAARAAAVDVTAALSPQKAAIGETVRLTVDVTYDPDVKLEAPEAEKLSFEPLETRDAVRVALPEEGGRKRLRYTMRLAGFRPGQVAVPPVRIPYKGGTAASQPLSLEILPPLAKEGDKPGEIRDIKPLVMEPVPAWMYAAAVVAALAGIGLLYLLVRAMLRLRRSRHAPPLSAEAWALQELDRLSNDALPILGDLKSHYERLGDILRGYLSRRYGILVLERTTAELLADLRAGDFADDLVPDVKAVLEEADLVKFARLALPGEHAQGRVDFVRRIVERTRPQPQVVAPQRVLAGKGG